MNQKVFTLPDGTRLVNIHSSSRCAGEWCVIHNPLDTYDRSRLHWRSDRGILEVICDHGVGHPVPEQHEYIMSTQGEGGLIHGCCAERCCEAYNDF